MATRELEAARRSSSIGSWVLETELPVRFTIRNSPGVFSPGNTDLLEFGATGPSARRLVVIDKNIVQHYLADVRSYFAHHGVEAHIVAIAATEEDKGLESLLIVLKEMEKFGILRRNEPLIAVGGGVLLDVAGMAASLYRRGVPYIRVPTTLVGLVDASVGAKTGINFEGRRNRLGTYYPPIASYLDKAFLRTLETIEISSGLGEILKMAVIKSNELFLLLEEYGTELVETKFIGCEVADDVINLAAHGMIEELEPNLWEKNLARIVDFGHSFSPIIEMRSIEENEFEPLTHGQAVALDVLFSSVLSCNRGMLPREDLMRIARTQRSMGLPTDHVLFHEPLVLLEALNDTMKHRNGDQHLPLPRGIGDPVFANDVTLDEIRRTVAGLTAVNAELRQG